MRRITATIGVILIVTGLLSACGPNKAAGEENHLRVGVLPIIEVIPLYVAEQNGYFEDAGLNVEIVPVKGAQERDALMQAGELDGMWSDLVAVGLFNRDQSQIKVVATGYHANPEVTMFRILAAPGSGITTAQDLAGVPVGLSQNTVAEYLTDRLLAAEGLPVDQIETIEVSAIPVRFEQLMEGQIKAAALPDPLARGAMETGATQIVDDRWHPEYSQGVFVFSNQAMEDKPEAIGKFLKAWDQAVEELRENPADYVQLLIEKGGVPESIQETYQVPLFPLRNLPTEAEWQDVVDWLIDSGLVEQNLEYNESIVKDYWDH